MFEHFYPPQRSNLRRAYNDDDDKKKGMAARAASSTQPETENKKYLKHNKTFTVINLFIKFAVEMFLGMFEISVSSVIIATYISPPTCRQSYLECDTLRTPVELII